MSDLRFKTEEKILWNGPFVHYGKEEADFADVRNYIYRGKKVDQQVHLGFDLSDVQNAPVNAANDGRCRVGPPIWASTGTVSCWDHGYSLQSIYGHMRQIDVKVGDMVKKDQKDGGSRARRDWPAEFMCTSACRSMACRSIQREWWDGALDQRQDSEQTGSD